MNKHQIITQTAKHHGYKGQNKCSLKPAVWLAYHWLYEHPQRTPHCCPKATRAAVAYALFKTRGVNDNDAPFIDKLQSFEHPPTPQAFGRMVKEMRRI